jgi:hypothetical protein
MTRNPLRRSAPSGGNPPGFGPEPRTDIDQGGAPGGLWPSESELPIVSVPGGNPTDLTGRPDSTPNEPMLPQRGEPTNPER